MLAQDHMTSSSAQPRGKDEGSDNEQAQVAQAQSECGWHHTSLKCISAQQPPPQPAGGPRERSGRLQLKLLLILSPKQKYSMKNTSVLLIVIKIIRIHKNGPLTYMIMLQIMFQWLKFDCEVYWIDWRQFDYSITGNRAITDQ